MGDLSTKVRGITFEQYEAAAASGYLWRAGPERGEEAGLPLDAGIPHVGKGGGDNRPHPRPLGLPQRVCVDLLGEDV